MIVPADSENSKICNLKIFKSVISDYNKKIVDEKCTKYHLNLSESPEGNKKLEIDLYENISDPAGNLGTNDDQYDRTINNAFKKKLRKRSIRSMILLNFSN
jgi:hypothetical protein